MSNNNVMLKMENLKTYFYTDKGIVPAVDGVDIQIKNKKIIGLVGESGCGKSVTALSILKLISSPGKIVDGKILFEGKDILDMTKKQIHSIRGNEISMIFQEPMTSLNPVYKVGKQVMESILIHKNISKKEAREKTIHMLNKVGIPEPEKRIDTYPHQLSGGLRQRVMIAMALICRPKLLIADEPTTALDVTIQAQILNLMRMLQDEIGSSILMITHDMGVVAEVCDEVNVMYAGKIMEYSDVFNIFEDPLHPYTWGLLKSIPKLHKNNTRLYNIKGTVPSLLQLPKGCRFCPRCEFAEKLCKEKEPPLFNINGDHWVRCWRYRK